jgi:hypothetical protein
VVEGTFPTRCPCEVRLTRRVERREKRRRKATISKATYQRRDRWLAVDNNYRQRYIGCVAHTCC